jgi:uncharacterized metal-binding protein YceD (DUF177 family)
VPALSGTHGVSSGCDIPAGAGEPASLAEIITDEVLLALPIVPLHGGTSTCRPPVMDYQTPANSQRENPFAVLAKLKQKP